MSGERRLVGSGAAVHRVHGLVEGSGTASADVLSIVKTGRRKGVRATALPSSMPCAKFGLARSFARRWHAGLCARLVSATALFDAVAIGRFARRCVELLAPARDRPGAAIGELQGLPETERRKIAAPGVSSACASSST
ncbi:hypothetical protein OIV53_31505, partial [Burkholderia pseudomallei]|uniref:hypothetical protein n=1 Tax=Burkholderia pseudomallei TaxID=28450 RepID=UPI0021F6D5BD